MLQNTVTGFVRQMREIESRRPGALLLLDVDQLSPPAQSELAGLLALPDFELFTICTSRQSLLDLAAQGQFQFELACRLSTVVLHMTPLAERPEDIPLLAQFFVEQYNAEGGSQRAGFTEEAVDRLVAYDWPENVEELAEIVGQACRRADGPRVGSEDLPELIHLAARLTSRPPAQIETIQLDAFLQQIECELLSRALQAAKGNKSKAADLLGISRARLHRRLEQLGIS
jgi:DNA-binding NtrC family response regulator